MYLLWDFINDDFDIAIQNTIQEFSSRHDIKRFILIIDVLIPNITKWESSQEKVKIEECFNACKEFHFGLIQFGISSDASGTPGHTCL